MTPALATVMAGSSMIGACCAMGAPRALRPLAVTVNLLGTLAGVDHLNSALTSTATAVPTAVWAVVLGVAALFSAAGQRMAGAGPRMHGVMTAHRSLGTLIMAGMLLSSGAVMDVTTAPGHAHSSNIGAMLLLGSIGLAALAVPAVKPVTGRLRLVMGIECAAMTGSCLVMVLWHMWCGIAGS